MAHTLIGGIGAMHDHDVADDRDHHDE